MIGWEAFLVLLDVRGLSVSRARALTLRAAEAIPDGTPAKADRT